MNQKEKYELVLKWMDENFRVEGRTKVWYKTRCFYKLENDLEYILFFEIGKHLGLEKKLDIAYAISHNIFEWPLCIECGKKVRNINNTFCSKECIHKSDYRVQKIKQTKKERYGDENYNNYEKFKQTNLKKYGVENISQLEVIKQKKKETLIENFGSLEEAEKYKRNKQKHTNRKKYGVDHHTQTEDWDLKVKERNLKKYGVEYYFQTEEQKEKSKQTKKERYGDENYNNMEKNRQTMLEKYGVEHSSHMDDFVEKSKQTKKERYGDENYTNVEKYKKTCLERYGVESPQQLALFRQKAYDTRRKNGNLSKDEIYIESKLKEKFPNVKSQYKSEQYPFFCDFYIPELDLYIEYQGYWTHGKKPYNSNDENHISILEEWNEKNTKQYEAAIYVWTDLDPKKRKTAIENNLNWIEFFNLQQFDEWYERI